MSSTLHTHHVIGGGTISPLRTHMAIASEAYGETARYIHNALQADGHQSQLHLTKMACAGQSDLRTSHDIRRLTDDLVAQADTKIIFFNPAIVDYDGIIGDVPSHRHATRLQTRSNVAPTIQLNAADKIVSSIRQNRKDIYLVAFKTTSGVSEDEQYMQALRLLKESSANLVLANDVVTRTNMIVTPEEARYDVTQNRELALNSLVHMALARSQLRFTRSHVANSEKVNWNGSEVPNNLRAVVNHLISRGAYQPFQGKTVGHFATRGANPNEFLTSERKSNFNELSENGLIRVVAQDNDTVVAFGGKPSVGGQSQRIIFRENPELDAIAHFHCAVRSDAVDDIPVRTQRYVECGSHECGQNTADGLREVRPGIHAVMLENHGPNIVFGPKTASNDIIDFIEDNFDLGQKTGGNIPPAYRALTHA